MQQILILGGGAAGLAAALAAAQTAEGRAHITVLDKNAKVGKKLLATGNGRCNLDNRDITPERYFTSSPKALRRLLSAVDEAAPLAWFESLGLYPRTDEAGRVYPYSNQAADVLALLEHHLSRLGVEVRTGCTVQNLSQSRGGYAVQIETEAGRETLRADAVICAMGGDAGPQFGTDGFGTRFAAQCGGRMAPLYPCLTALQCAHPRKPLAGIRAKGCASLLDGADGRVLARETGEVQFTEYGLSGICIMQLSGLLAPGRGPKRPVVALDLFPALSETELAALFAQRVGLLGSEAAEFWLGLLPAKLGRALWAEEYGTPYGYTAINLKLKANASYATQKSIAGLVTRRGGVLRTNSYETARRMYQEGSTGAFFWAVAGVVGAALALFLLWNLFGLYWQHQRLRIGIFQAEGTSAAMLRHCGIRQGVLAVLGALLLGNLAVWGLWRWSWHSLVTRQSGRILTFAALPMAVSEYPWALHLAVCAGYLLFVLALQLAPLERLARSQPMDNLKKGV